MALPVITIKNTDSLQRTACGIRFDPNASVEIEPHDKLALSANQRFIGDLVDGYFEVYYDGYVLPAETGLAVLKGDVYVKIDGQELGYAHTIDFKGIFGVVGHGTGGSIEVETGSSVNLEDIENLTLILDGYETKVYHNADITNILNALDGYETEDIKVKVSGTDTTDGYLFDKTSAGPGITLVTLNGGGDEKLEVSITPGILDGYITSSGSDINVKVSATDTTTGYLTDKTSAGAGISIVKLNSGGDEELEISITPGILDGYGSGSGGIEDYQYVENLSESQTTSTSWQTKVTLTTPSLTGTYLVQWMAIGTQKNFPGEFRLWNNTDSVDYMEHSIDDNAPPSNNYRHVGGFTEIEFSGSQKDFEVQWRSTANKKKVYIKDAKIMLWKVG